MPLRLGRMPAGASVVPSRPESLRSTSRPETTPSSVSTATPGPVDTFVTTRATAVGPAPATILPARWNLVTLMAADNNLAAYTDTDLREMAAGGSIAGTLNLFTFVDRPNSPSQFLYFPPGGRQAVALDVPPESSLGRLTAGGKANTGDPALLRAVIEHVQRLAPSQELAVNLWGHGAGWEGVMVDEGADRDRLTLADGELRRALEGLGVDVLISDACLMAAFEVADSAAAIGAKRLVASENVEPGEGFDYRDFLSRTKQTMQGGHSLDASMLCSLLVASARRGTSLTTLSAMRLEGLPQLKSAMSRFAAVLAEAGGLPNVRALRETWNSVPRFENEQADLGLLARAFGARFPPGALRDAAREMWDAVHPVSGEYFNNFNNHAPQAPGTGLAIYAPILEDNLDSTEKYSNSPEWRGSPWASMLCYRPPAPVRTPAWAVPLAEPERCFPFPPPHYPFQDVPEAIPPQTASTPAAPTLSASPVATTPQPPVAPELTPEDDPAAANAWHLNVAGPLRSELRGRVLHIEALHHKRGYKPLARVHEDPVTRRLTVSLDAYCPTSMPQWDEPETLTWNVSLAGLPSGRWHLEMRNTATTVIAPLSELHLPP